MPTSERKASKVFPLHQPLRPRSHCKTDLNGKLAVELLFGFDGGRPNTPSGSREKEGLLMEQRKDIMAEVRL